MEGRELQKGDEEARGAWKRQHRLLASNQRKETQRRKDLRESGGLGRTLEQTGPDSCRAEGVGEG